MNLLLDRRSIRKYKDEKISNEKIKMLIKAAMYAPSARNYQPWEFVIIDDRDVLDKIPEFHPYAGMMKKASHGIVVCGDLNVEENVNYVNQNCSAATQNILLAAHGLGLGAVWLGVFPREQRVNGLKELLGLPENILPVSLISIGYPAEEKKRPDRFDRSKMHYNKWGNK